jgi:hypothetical protein
MKRVTSGESKRLGLLAPHAKNALREGIPARQRRLQPLEWPLLPFIAAAMDGAEPLQQKASGRRDR